MRVEELMQSDVCACRRNDSLADVSKLMWEGDLGAVPVVDEENRPIGVVTDRDICMAAYFSGRPTGELTVDLMTRATPATIRRQRTVEDAMKLMRERQVRRLPVTDDTGALVGMLSLGDLAVEDGGYSEEVAKTLAAISEPHHDRTRRPLRTDTADSDGVAASQPARIASPGAASAEHASEPARAKKTSRNAGGANPSKRMNPR